MKASHQKTAAHDRYVCFRCRFSAKRERVDVRASDRPSYLCPKCREAMVWSGTAFRPPPRDDDEAWRVAEALIASGFRFVATRTRQRLPKTMAEFERWQATRGESWAKERPLVRSLASNGTSEWSCAGVALTHGQKVLVWVERHWHQGEVKLQGDGAKPLSSPCVWVRDLDRLVSLSTKSRLRLLA